MAELLEQVESHSTRVSPRKSAKTV
jgi:hypothetical protein